MLKYSNTIEKICDEFLEYVVFFEEPRFSIQSNFQEIFEYFNKETTAHISS